MVGAGYAVHGVWAVVVLLLAAANADESEGGAGRSLQMNVPDKTCQNSISGMWYMADDEGYVCGRDDFDAGITGCCDQSAGTKHDCSGCDDTKCCTEYEYCISCCMKPGNGASELSKTANRSRQRGETGKFKTQFEYCAGRCRTFSKSVVHENAYIQDKHHCFAEDHGPTPTPAPQARALPQPRVMPKVSPATVLVKPQVQVGSALATASQNRGGQQGGGGGQWQQQQRPVAAGAGLRPNGQGAHASVVHRAAEMERLFEPVPAAVGKSCTETCKTQGRGCLKDGLSAINTCERLTAYFGCQGGCRQGLGNYQPAYVPPTAMKVLMPNTCFMSLRPEMFDCDSRHAASRRLCPCSKGGM